MADLASLADVKAYLGISDASDDAILTRLLAAASGWIRAQTGRAFEATAQTEVLEGSGGPALLLPAYPITAVSSVKIDGDTVPARVTAGDGGWWFTSNLLRRDGGTFPRGALVEVAYTAGHAAVPVDVAQAAIELVAWRYKERDRVGQQSKSVGGETIAFQTYAAPSSVNAVIEAHRRR